MTKVEHQRGDRHEHRETLKEYANRHNTEAAMHPQVRRQVEDEREQREAVRTEEPSGEVTEE